MMPARASTFSRARILSRNPTPSRSTGTVAATATERTKKKAELLSAAAKVNRGVSATEEDMKHIDSLARDLERLNPNKNSLKCPEINGKWRLAYTTSESILGTKRPPPLRSWGPIFQTIDARKLKARNNETFPFFNSVSASLTPVNNQKVDVQFEYFKIGNLLPIKAPRSATGSLDTTYVDEELRISRGDKGNLFVLTMEDPSATL